MDIVDQLLEIYYEKEDWHTIKLDKDKAYRYFDNLVKSGNILYYEEEKVIGYTEFWKVNYEQFGRIVCNESFSPNDENVTDGNIAFIVNMYIDKECRRSKAISKMGIEFFKRTGFCKHYSWERSSRLNACFKVFTREQMLHKFGGV